MEKTLTFLSLKELLEYENKNKIYLKYYLSKNIKFYLSDNHKKYFFREFSSDLTKQHILNNNYHEYWKYCNYNKNILSECSHVINWSYLNQNNKIPEKFFSMNLDKIDWNKFNYDRNLSDDFIKKNREKINWKNFTKFGKINLNIYKEFEDYITWNFVLLNKNLSFYIFKRIKNKLNWKNILIHEDISEKILKKIKNRINWKINSNLSLKFFQKHKDLLFEKFYKDDCIYYLDIFKIIRYDSILEPKFIECIEKKYNKNFFEVLKIFPQKIKRNNFYKLLDRLVNKDVILDDEELNVSSYDPNNYDFTISEFEIIAYSPNFTEDFLRKHKKLLNWNIMFAICNLSEEFIMENEKYIDISAEKLIKNKQVYNTHIPMKFFARKCKDIKDVNGFIYNTDKSENIYHKIFYDTYFKNFTIDINMILKDFINIKNFTKNKKHFIKNLNLKNVYFNEECLENLLDFERDVKIDLSIIDFIRFYGFNKPYKKYVNFYDFHVNKLNKIIFLQKKIKHWLYKPHGIMYEKSLNSFTSLLSIL